MISTGLTTMKKIPTNTGICYLDYNLIIWYIMYDFGGQRTCLIHLRDVKQNITKKTKKKMKIVDVQFNDQIVICYNFGIIYYPKRIE